MQLCERMDWRQVWGQDKVYLSNVGKMWAAWNVVEWTKHWKDVRHV